MFHLPGLKRRESVQVFGPKLRGTDKDDLEKLVDSFLSLRSFLQEKGRL